MNIGGHYGNRGLLTDKLDVKTSDGRVGGGKITWSGRKASIVEKNDSHQPRGMASSGLSTKGKVVVCAAALLNFADRSSAQHSTEKLSDQCADVACEGVLKPPPFPPFPPFLGPGEPNEAMRDTVCATASEQLSEGLCSSSIEIKSHPACVYVNDWYRKTCETVQNTTSTQISITPQVNITDTINSGDSEFDYLPIIVTCIVVLLGLTSALVFFCYYRSSNSVKNTATEEENMSMTDIEKSGESDVEENTKEIAAMIEAETGRN